ncbi:hypothetical protein L207DRAFT_590317 [Hyaloscypha variabilis F]|uniref:Uncharacterized protein n=1 Tax=Hyaloscypha variabilis (strain UAMH 11265 / GT02V1 / F) TaxID=1149755 RepID=A0A2J6R2B7_HYAVF|nr:hypothetical protein L207DRAFT_590317 [Hyaloscypha variabilis F]
MRIILFRPSRWVLYLFTFHVLSFTKESVSQAIVASSDEHLQPRITPPPSVNNLDSRQNSQNFIGYYESDGTWQSTDCGTQTFAVSSLLGYCCTTGTSCDHPTSCSDGYVMGAQGAFVCEGSGYTCGSAFLAASFGAQPVTTFIQCFPPDMTLTSWYRTEDLAAASTTSSSSTSSIRISPTASSVSSSSDTLAGSSTTQTLPPSTPASTPSTDPLQRSSDVSAIVGGVVGPLAFVAAMIFGINQWKRREQN